MPKGIPNKTKAKKVEQYIEPESKYSGVAIGEENVKTPDPDWIVTDEVTISAINEPSPNIILKQKPKPVVFLKDSDVNAEAYLTEALAPQIAQGLRIAVDDDVWTMSFKAMVDSGTMYQPIQSIIRCADRLINN